MGHVERRVWSGKASYRARYRDPAGRERSKSFRRKADAERWLAEIEHAKSHGTWTDPALGRIRFDDWLASWWATTTNLRPTTRARDELVLRLYALPRFGKVPLAAITQLDVRTWVAELSARGLTPATVTKTYQVFGKVMGAAVDAGYLAQTPCRNIPLPKIEREEMRFLTPAEIIGLADAIRPLYRTLVLVGAYGGLRIGELAGLRRGRVDLLRGTVTVAEIVTEVEGKLFFGLPKTRAGRRSVGLPRFVTRELEAHLADAGDPSDHVFTAPNGGPLRVTAFRARAWRPATRRRAWTGCASTTSGTPPSRSGSPLARAPRKLLPWPVTRRSASPSTATATYIPTPTPRWATASMPCTHPLRSVMQRSSTCRRRPDGNSAAATCSERLNMTALATSSLRFWAIEVRGFTQTSS
jgi:integrase